jgi:hypothetical protein
MKFIILRIYKKGDKTDYSSYRGISELPTAFTVLYSILVSRFIPYIGEIIGDHQCGFRRSR